MHIVRMLYTRLVLLVHRFKPSRERPDQKSRNSAYSTYSVHILYVSYGLCTFYRFYKFCRFYVFYTSIYAFFLRILCTHSVSYVLIFDGIPIGEILQPWRLKILINLKKAGERELSPLSEDPEVLPSRLPCGETN